MNGAFRIHVLAGTFESSKTSLAAFATFLASPTSFLNVHRPAAEVKSSIVDLLPSPAHLESTSSTFKPNPFFTFLTIFATPHTEWEISAIPYELRLYRDQIYSDDIFDMRLQASGKSHPLHDKYGVDVEKGAIAIVRPDGYVAAVVGINEAGFKGMNDYFAGFLL